MLRSVAASRSFRFLRQAGNSYGNHRAFRDAGGETLHGRLLNSESRVSQQQQQQRGKHAGGENTVARIARGGSVPVREETIGKLLGRAAARWPDRECAVSLHQNVRLTFSELIRRADRLAAGLFKLGMKRGDRLGVWGPNDVEWLIAFSCASRAGFVVVAINPSYQTDEIIYAVQKVGAKAVIAAENFKGQDYPAMLLRARQACPTLEHVIIYSEKHVNGTRRFSDVEALASRLEVERIAAEQDEISCRSGSNIQFTSGTTGRPKATLLSHRSLVTNSEQSSARTRMSGEGRVCLNVPLFHAFGTIKGILTTFHVGNTLVFQGRSFNPVQSLEAIAREKCDVVFGTPTMWINLLDVHRRLQPPPITLSCGVTGGAPASPELFRNIRETFNFENMKTIYGLTETSGANFQTMPDEDHELTDTTVGHLGDHIEAMVVDESGKPVAFGVPGELWIRGYCNMLEYFGDPENTKKTITEDGWLKTGDRFVLRSDGYGQIVGRIKDMLIRGGENIFPKEIEDVLVTHPQVVEVQVIGAHDKVYGEEVCACVRLREGANVSKEEIREFCRDRMAPFKIPRYVVFVQDYPKTASGKVQKHKLKQELERLRAIPVDDSVPAGKAGK